jgi:multidrug efflux pump subunit AcrB
LVDDAIVVVENIHRHIHLGGHTLVESIPLAVDEVGGPTILATFTVIAALLPMAFVSGLMGPYMSPIPINSSMGMLISLAVAFVFTPWLTYKVLRRVVERHHSTPSSVAEGEGNTAPSPPTPLPEGEGNHSQEDFSHRLFRRVVGPFLRGRQGPLRWLLGAVSCC